MRKRQLNYVKYTKKELDDYINDEKSCVQHINETVHISFPPWGLGDFKTSVLAIISRNMIGEYDEKLKGIILDVRNIKVQSNQWLTHNDNSDLHVDFKADFYVFRPQVGSTIRGVVNHIGRNQIGVIVYRVFNVSINLGKDYKRDAFELNTDVMLKIKSFDLLDLIPTIEGEVIEGVGLKKRFDDSDEIEDSGISTNETPERRVCVKQELCKTSDSDECVEKNINTKTKIKTASNVKQRKSRSTREVPSSSSSEDTDANSVHFESVTTRAMKRKRTTDSASNDTSDSQAKSPKLKIKRESSFESPKKSSPAKNHKKHRKTLSASICDSDDSLNSSSVRQKTKMTVKDAKPQLSDFDLKLAQLLDGHEEISPKKIKSEKR